MDKIREEFEKDFNIDSIYEYDGKWYTTDNLKKATEVQKVDCTTLNRILHGYRKGYKSRDEEITRLMEIIECKNILLIAYRLGTSRGVEKALDRLEALKDIT